MTDAQAEIGRSYRSGAYTIGEADLSWFAALSLDFARLHTDAAYAAKGVFGQRVGHGLLGMCLAEGLLSREREPAAAAFCWEWEFVEPFFIGDTIWAEAAMQAQEFVGPIRIGVESVQVFKNDGDLIQRGRHKIAWGNPDRAHAWPAAALSPSTGGFPPLRFEPEKDVPPSTSESRFADETGVFFEDLDTGDTFQTPAYTLSEIHAGIFAGMTGETGPWLCSRTDQEGERQVVPPIFGLALVEGLKNTLAPNAGVGTPMASLSWRWQQIAPLFVGDTLHADVRVEGRRASRTKTDRGLIAQSIALIAAGRGTVQCGQHVQMFRRRVAG